VLLQLSSSFRYKTDSKKHYSSELCLVVLTSRGCFVPGAKRTRMLVKVSYVTENNKKLFKFCETFVSLHTKIAKWKYLDFFTQIITMSPGRIFASYHKHKKIAGHQITGEKTNYYLRQNRA
jgi:hypothetical protein